MNPTDFIYCTPMPAMSLEISPEKVIRPSAFFFDIWSVHTIQKVFETEVFNILSQISQEKNKKFIMEVKLINEMFWFLNIITRINTCVGRNMLRKKLKIIW